MVSEIDNAFTNIGIDRRTIVDIFIISFKYMEAKVKSHLNDQSFTH